MSDNTSGWEIRFTQSARRHRIGRASAPRGRELEIVALEVADAVQPHLLVIHVMPTQRRG